MPVIDGTFIPNGELVLAETVVDFAALHQHVTDMRIIVETRADAAARRVAASAVEFQIPTEIAVRLLDHTLEQALRRTVRFGAAQARSELSRLRETDPVAAREIPDAGDYAREARNGLEGVFRLIRRRAREAADRISQAALAAAGTAYTDHPEDDTQRLAIVLAATAKSLHNHALELVGEAFNLGRTAGVVTLREPPTFAMRSEQMDKATCENCSRLHQAVVEVGSVSYFDYMPPSGCFGGGRCRGVYVFADGVSQVRAPDTAPGPQPELPAIPPVRQPRRRAA